MPKTRKTWIEAAVRAMEEGGLAAVTVSQLAETLGVVRSSFNHHFPGGLGELLDALLEYWYRERHERLAELALQVPAEARLQTAVNLASSVGSSLSASIRAWALHDERAAHVVARADYERVDMVARTLRELGCPEDQVRLRARVFVTLASTGLYLQLEPLTADEWERILTVLTGE